MNDSMIVKLSDLYNSQNGICKNLEIILPTGQHTPEITHMKVIRPFKNHIRYKSERVANTMHRIRQILPTSIRPA